MKDTMRTMGVITTPHHPTILNDPPPCMSDPKFYIHGLVLPSHATNLKRAHGAYELHMVGAH